MPVSIFPISTSAAPPPACKLSCPTTRTFRDTGRFAAVAAAERFLQAHGFSIGGMQFDSPRAVMFGRWVIAKWKYLSPEDLRGLHGWLAGDMAHGPVTLEIFATAPAEARVAFLGAEA